jgi:hypothetical protein
LFGGYVIARSTQIDSMRSWDFASRAFVHAPGLRPPDAAQGQDEQDRKP